MSLKSSNHIVTALGSAFSFHDRGAGGGWGAKCEGQGSIVNERGEGNGTDYPLASF